MPALSTIFLYPLAYPKEKELIAMEVHFTPEVQAKLDQMARESGRRSDELLEDAVIGYFDELANARETLDRRYDDLESGRVKPIPGDEVAAYFREKSAAARRSQPD
jgi:predicted transcriptional regulator